ncbi:MAG TPA: M14 family zinc carboxypeptidase [Gemmatimonadaceae bacterium]
MPTRRLILLGALLFPCVAGAQQPLDSAYTARIRELTPTDPVWKFTTELVDHLPASATVPTPLKVLGYVPGTIGRLAYVEELNRYFRAVERASPRVRVYSLGTSDEGREMIIAAVADSATIARIDDFRAMTARLADPRGVAPAERARLIHEAKPIYWLTGSIHSPETGSPEMLMELLYRLAVEETPHVQAIRDHVITLITPATEVDGRDRMVDVAKLSRSLGLGPNGVSLTYWGKYTAHDNNRDGMVLSQKLTQHVMEGFLHWHPTVMHDLHESVAFLHTSTGTGPYNDEFDPIVIDEWHTLAYQEITELTKRGLPGVWTHGFYDGWAPNYMLAIANLHNSIGRFYETYTSMNADCHVTNLPPAQTERRWDRPSPPVNGVRWCIRSNINYQESGVLTALKYVADHPATFLENFALKAERQVAKGKSSAPYAFVIPRGQRRAAEAADLVNLFRRHATEIHVASADVTLKGDGAKAAPVTVHAGDWIVRMDQPYTQTARTLLAIQKFKPDDPSPYDDTGWTLDELRHVQTLKIADPAVLTAPMTRLDGDATVRGTIAGSGAVLLVAHAGDWRSAALPWKTGRAAVSVADTAFSIGGKSFDRGTFIVERGDQSARDAIATLGLSATAVADVPRVRRHPVSAPRIALVHTWIETQNEGWVRYAFDQMGIPFTYLADQRLAQPGALDGYDVVMFPHVSGAATTIVNGRPLVGPAIPWKRTSLTPNLGKWDETDDVRPGMGLAGLAALRRFVERGGLLVVEGNTARVPIEFGLVPTVSVAPQQKLQARGGVYRAQVMRPESPIAYGYERAVFPLYFNQAPLLAVQAPPPAANRPVGVDSAILNETERQRARTIVRWSPRVDSLLVSGLLDAGEEMAGRATVVDAPLGRGHVVLFGTRPMWRWQSQGAFALVLNAMANWNALDVNERAAPSVTSTAAASGER